MINREFIAGFLQGFLSVASLIIPILYMMVYERDNVQLIDGCIAWSVLWLTGLFTWCLRNSEETM